MTLKHHLLFKSQHATAAKRQENSTQSCSALVLFAIVHLPHTVTSPAPLLLPRSLLLLLLPLLLLLLLVPLLAPPLPVRFLLLSALRSIRGPFLPLYFQLPVQPLPPLLLPALVTLEAVTRAIMS